jgi:uncharacterized protein (DUF488 family)
MPNVLHTMGLGNRSLETIFELLAVARAKRVVDIRRYPTSERYPHLDARVLHGALRDRGIEVVPMGDLLGGDRRGGFEKYMATAAFRRGLGRLEALARQAPTAILCAEREPDRCHRRFLAAALEERGWKVAHHRSTLSERTARGEMRLVRKTAG